MGLLKQLFGDEEGEQEKASSGGKGSKVKGPKGSIGSLVSATDSWQERARALNDAGRRALDDGDYELAVSHLLDAVRLLEARGDEEGALQVSPFLGAALYGQGRKEEAVSVLEEVMSRGSEEPLVYQLLVGHYEEAGMADEAARVRSLSPAEASE